MPCRDRCTASLRQLTALILAVGSSVDRARRRTASRAQTADALREDNRSSSSGQRPGRARAPRPTPVHRARGELLPALQGRRPVARRAHRARSSRSRRRPPDRPGDRRSRCRPSEAEQSAAGSIPRSYLTGQLPVTASGRRRDGRRQGQVSSSSRAAITGVPIPKSLLAQIVNYFTRTPTIRRASASTTPSSCPPRSGESTSTPGAGHRRAVAAMRRRRPADAAAVLKGVGPAARGRSQGGRPQHRRRSPAAAFRSATKIARHAADRSLRPGRHAAIVGRVAQREPRARRGGRASRCSRRWCGTTAGRSRRCGRTRLPPGRDPAAAAHRALRQGRDWGSAAGCRSPIPSSRSSVGTPDETGDAGDRRHRPYRPHRAGLRADRQRDDEHAAPPRAEALEQLPAALDDPLPDDIRMRRSLPDAARALARGALSRRRTPSSTR